MQVVCTDKLYFMPIFSLLVFLRTRPITSFYDCHFQHIKPCTQNYVRDNVCKIIGRYFTANHSNTCFAVIIYLMVLFFFIFFNMGRKQEKKITCNRRFSTISSTMIIIVSLFYFILFLKIKKA